MSKKIRKKNLKYYLFLWTLNISRFFLMKLKNIAHHSYKKIDWKSLKKNKRGEIVKDLKLFQNKISKVLRNGDYLMIKGSNATKLHEVSRKFIGVGN